MRTIILSNPLTLLNFTQRFLHKEVIQLETIDRKSFNRRLCYFQKLKDGLRQSFCNEYSELMKYLII